MASERTIEDLVRLAAAGDEQAVTNLYEETSSHAYYLALQLVKDEDTADDVLQDSYVKALSGLSTLDDPSKFQSWLNSIVVNTSKDYLRKKKPVLFSQLGSNDDSDEPVDFVDESEQFSPEASVDYNETKRLVKEMIDNLPEEQRIAIILHYMEDYSVKDIARVMGCSEGTVKSRLNYGRKQIEKDVLDLEKKGVKLYCAPLAPFLFWMFHTPTASAVISPSATGTDAASTVGSTVTAGTAGGATVGSTVTTGTAEGASVGSTVTAGTAGGASVGATVAAGSAEGAAVGATVTTGTAGGATVGATVTAGTAEGAAVGATVTTGAAATEAAAGAAATAGGLSLAAKIGIVAAVIVIGGGAAVGATVAFRDTEREELIEEYVPEETAVEIEAIIEQDHEHSEMEVEEEIPDIVYDVNDLSEEQQKMLGPMDSLAYRMQGSSSHYESYDANDPEFLWDSLIFFIASYQPNIDDGTGRMTFDGSWVTTAKDLVNEYAGILFPDYGGTLPPITTYLLDGPVPPHWDGDNLMVFCGDREPESWLISSWIEHSDGTVTARTQIIDDENEVLLGEFEFTLAENPDPDATYKYVITSAEVVDLYSSGASTPVTLNQGTTDNTYILPDSDSRYYTESELNRFTKAELRLARNEIYARKGRMFDSADLDEYFRSQSWYNPTIPANRFTDNMLNAYERQNVQVIKSVEDRK